MAILCKIELVRRMITELMRCETVFDAPGPDGTIKGLVELIAEVHTADLRRRTLRLIHPVF
jgi:hypothetical protein